MRGRGCAAMRCRRSRGRCSRSAAAAAARKGTSATLRACARSLRSFVPNASFISRRSPSCSKDTAPRARRTRSTGWVPSTCSSASVFRLRAQRPAGHDGQGLCRVGGPARGDAPLDGYDPYANSKSWCELAAACYARCYLRGRTALSVMRAGQRAGGGDIAPGRILPDCIRAARKGEPIAVRSPDSVRPYQHVFDVLAAYLAVARAQRKIPLWRAATTWARTLRVPDDGQLADLFCAAWEGASWKAEPSADARLARVARPSPGRMEAAPHVRHLSPPHGGGRRAGCRRMGEGARGGGGHGALCRCAAYALFFGRGYVFESRAARSGGPDPAAGRPARRPPCFSPFRRRFTVPRGPSACAAPFVPVARRPPSLSPFCRRFWPRHPIFFRNISDGGRILRAEVSTMFVANLISYILVLLGAVNWGLYGIFNFNLVSAVFRGDRSVGSIVRVCADRARGAVAAYLYRVCGRHTAPRRSPRPHIRLRAPGGLRRRQRGCRQSRGAR